MDIFLTFTILSIIFAFVGYFINNELMLILGLSGLMFMSLPLLTGSLEYRTGADIVTNYVYNGTSISSNSNTLSYNYQVYENTIWYGVFFMLISISGLFYYFKEYRDERNNNEED